MLLFLICLLLAATAAGPAPAPAAQAGQPEADDHEPPAAPRTKGVRKG